MKLTKLNLMFSQSMFLKLVSSFLLIIIILSSFYLVSYNFFIKNIEYEIVNNANERLDNVVNKIDKSLVQVKNILLKLSQEDFFSSVSSGQVPSPEIKKLMIETFNSYKLLVDYDTSYIDIIYILPASPQDSLMTSESSYNIKTFFDLFYSNPKYTEKFWLNEIGQDFNFKFYPSGQFIDKSHYNNHKDVSSSLMPLALKSKNNSNYIMVALIDIKALFRSADESFANNFCIYSNDNEILYSTIEESLLKDINFSKVEGYAKVRQGYALTRNSTENNLQYCRLLSNAKLKNQLTKTNTIFKLISIISLITSIFISIYIVKRFNNPVKQIVAILKKSQNQENHNPRSVNLIYLRDSIQNLVAENSDYIKDLDTKNSLLKTLSYQASIKNIYPDIKNQLDIKCNYIVVNFKIHFKPSYYENVSSDKSTATYCLTELVQLYVNTCFKESVTFQAENDQIVSVINISQDMSDVEINIPAIANKLKSEEEYVFFTIAMSKTHYDITELNKAYNHSLEISEYRMPIAETQILSESIVNKTNNKFYFSLEQVEQFINSLYNSQNQKCISIVNNVIDYNSRKGVNCFYIQALCNEIVNSCIKALIKSFYDVPAEIEINSIYYQIKQSSTIDEFKYLLVNFVSLVSDFIAKNQKQSDYIIDSITNYIDEHYAEDIYVDLLAEKLSLTSNYVSSYFKDKVGINLNDYINNFRIRKSIEFLESSSAKVKDIAVLVGISNVNTFIRIFKKYAGKTPVDYRRQLGCMQETVTHPLTKS